MNKYLNNTTAQIKVKWKRCKELSMSADVLKD